MILPFPKLNWIVLALNFGFTLHAYAQLSDSVTAVQYYFDTDPGIGIAGNGAVIAVNPTVNLNDTFSFAIPGALSEGIHQLFLRGKNAYGRWSIPGRQMFYVSDVLIGTNQVTAYQYFFDTDPGIGIAGNGAVVSIPSTSSYSGLLNLIVPANLSDGLHQVYIRGKDQLGRWSMMQRSTFYVSSVTDGTKNIIAYQYYFDTDPGVGVAGNGAIIPVTPTSGLNTLLNLSIPNSLSKGVHMLYIRSKDAAGRWSNISRDFLYISDVANGPHEVSYLEYYFDTDPGAGNAYPYPGTVNGDVNIPVFMGVSCLLPGTHYYYLRAKDNFGRWSMIGRDTLTILPGVAPSIVTPVGPLTLCLGDTFSLSALQIPGVGYRWLKNNVPIPGATTAKLFATDTANYTLRAICAWDSSVSNTVMVIPDHQPPEISCHYYASRSTNPGVCTYTISGSELDPASVIDNCPDFIYWNNMTNTSSLNGVTLPLGPTNITWIVDDAHGSRDTCVHTILVEDMESPQIICPSPMIRTTDNGTCTYMISGTEFDPILASDNCNAYFYFNSLTSSTTLDDAILPLGLTHIEWTINDGHGQTKSCILSVTVIDDEPPSITCAANAVRNIASGFCDYRVAGSEFDPLNVDDNCTSFSYFNSITNTNTLDGVVWPPGVHAAQWTINDSHGHTASCTVEVSVEDNLPPSIQCPSDQILAISSGICDTIFNYLPVITNFCGDETFTLVSGIGSGNSFPFGISHEVLMVEDGGGNSGTCTFQVTVTKIPDLVQDTICYGDSIYLQGSYRYLPGLYTDVFQNQNNCDSVVVTSLATKTVCFWPTTIVYVDSSSLGDNTGVDWDNAYIDLQLALDVGKRYQNIRQIWVADGTYFPTHTTSRSKSFILGDSLIILGGFQGIELDSALRNPSMYKVYLSGDIGIPHDSSDNSYHILINPEYSAGTRLDGFTILYGTANGIDTLNQSGGGISNYGKLVLSNSSIKKCVSIGSGALILNRGILANLFLKNVELNGQNAVQVSNKNQAKCIVIGSLIELSQ